ncbi:SIR2 family NAD-dependent protein deacylase [Methylosinus sporium]|uniref:SIR2 family protein n=1 Tax=Methylosinus sporium TaxID=428 RepID=A0A549T165_METSR|nr:SIR2 family protein [Methylocystis sp. MitZ-2018]TRL35601.1 SIR2 family protein [Methylosinus sporium]
MLSAIKTGFERGLVIPYLGPGVLTLATGGNPVPASPEELVVQLTKAATVPHKIRNNLTAAAQYIENFKHRKTISAAMKKAFEISPEPSVLHNWIAEQPSLPLVVNAWYDDLPQKALAGRKSWGIVQGVSQAEHFGYWVNYFRPDSSLVPNKEFHRDGSGAKAPAEAPEETLSWETLLYQPIGSVTPAANFVISDSDYVEVLTEIDIQTPIPEAVQSIRKGRGFLFLGCRFTTQLERNFARQIMKRSSDQHWAVIEGPLTKNEAKFLAEQNITRIETPLAEFVASLTGQAIVASSADAAA